MNLNKIPKIFFSYNLKIITFLFLANFLGAYGQLINRLPLKIDSLFALNVEQNIPTFYSGLSLFLASFLLFIFSYQKKQKYSIKLYPFFLSLIFLILSYDELFQVHEKITGVVQDLLILNNNIFLRYSWVIPYFILVVLTFLLSINFLKELPKKISKNIIIAGFIYCFGELFLETIASMIDFYSLQNPESLFYSYLSYSISSLEELLGMFGICLFNYSILCLIVNSNKYKKF